ncbi:pectin lyase-like protein [Ascobolus immersus RN42]|uniref:Pectin lyase-like protein n=1 Tax=Ascobolus immersus RN42 TaxID=1160509 RepID=A0A3N4IGF4_ASCIM|nr:pectin lyase-like protein [Ascobolus immersus RN42]
MSDVFVFLGACAATAFGYLARHYGMAKLLWAWGFFMQGWKQAKPGYFTSFLSRFTTGTATGQEKQQHESENWWSGINEKARLLEEGRSEDHVVTEDGARDALVEPNAEDAHGASEGDGLKKLFKRGLELFEDASEDEPETAMDNSGYRNTNLHRRATEINPNWNLSKNYPDEINPSVKASINGTTLPIMAYYGEYSFTHVFVRGDDNLKVRVRPAKGDFNNWRVSPAPRLGVQDIKTSDGAVEFVLTSQQWKTHGYWIVKMEGYRALIILIDEEEDDEFSGDGIFYPSNYNVIKDGSAFATVGIQKALDDASAWGKKNGRHGKVVISYGKYLVGNLNIDSYTHIHFQPGAVFTFSGFRKDYRDDWLKSSANRYITWWLSTVQGSKNIKITGRGGLLDGNGKTSMDRGFDNGIGCAAMVPINTENFEWDGPIIKETGLWAFVPARSKNLTIKNLKVLNRLDMGEVDCIDVCESQNVTINRAIGIGLDDPFSTKTWENDKDVSRNWKGEPQQNKGITFRNCVAWTHCFGFKVGQGVMQDQSDILFEDCSVFNASVGIGVHHRWGKKTAMNIRFNNISIERITSTNMKMRTWFSVFVDAGDANSGGPIKNVTFENIKVLDIGTTKAKIEGTKGSIDGVSFRNVKILGKIAKSYDDLNIDRTLIDPNLVRGIVVLSTGTGRRKRREYAL